MHTTTITNSSRVRSLAITSRARRIVCSVLAAATVATAAMAIGAPAAPLDSAFAATSFAGKVTLNGSGVPGATVTVFRYDSTWVRTSVKTTTDANGRYYVGGLSNWKHYSLEGYSTRNYCYALGYFQSFRGYSAVAYATGGDRGANIAINFERNWSCY